MKLELEALASDSHITTREIRDGADEFVTPAANKLTTAGKRIWEDTKFEVR
jgi:hypothetical protein